MPEEDPSQVVVPEEWKICTVDLSAHDGEALRNIRKATENVLRCIRGIRFGDEQPGQVVIIMRDNRDDVPPSFGVTLKLLRTSCQAVISFGEEV